MPEYTAMATMSVIQPNIHKIDPVIVLLQYNDNQYLINMCHNFLLPHFYNQIEAVYTGESDITVMITIRVVNQAPFIITQSSGLVLLREYYDFRSREEVDRPESYPPIKELPRR